MMQKFVDQHVSTGSIEINNDCSYEIERTSRLRADLVATRQKLTATASQSSRVAHSGSLCRRSATSSAPCAMPAVSAPAPPASPVWWLTMFGSQPG